MKAGINIVSIQLKSTVSSSSSPSSHIQYACAYFQQSVRQEVARTMAALDMFARACEKAEKLVGVLVHRRIVP